jgi:hypothetical protein
MIGSIAIPDPTAAMMLTEPRIQIWQSVDELGQLYRGRSEVRRRQRRFQRHARLRRLLA